MADATTVSTVSSISNLLAAFGGAAITGIITAGLSFLNNRANYKRLKMQHEHEVKLKNKELLLVKLEELTGLLINYNYNEGKVKSYYFNNISRGSSHVKNLREGNEYKKEKVYEARIQNLIFLYFQDEIENFHDLSILKEKLLDLEHRVFLVKKEGDNEVVESFTAKFKEKISLFESKRQDLIIDISERIEIL